MKLINRTRWRTNDLKRIASRVAREELNDTPRQRRQRKDLEVEIVYSASGRHTGCAYLRGAYARIRLPRPRPLPERLKTRLLTEGRADTIARFEDYHKPDPVTLAWLFAHEFAHVRGQRHATMTGDVMRCTNTARARYVWAAELPIRLKTEKPKPTSVDRVGARFTHARVMLAKAETRRKRAVTIEKKWRAKVRYYERTLAARRDR